MKKTATFLMGAALMMMPLWTAAPAQAQGSLSRQIQEDENRIESAKERGDWTAVNQYQRDLNRDRLRYQQNHGDYYERDDYSDNGWNNGPNYNYQNRRYNIYQNQRNNSGYVDSWGHWHRY